MEPIMKVEVVTPEESMGDVISDLNKVWTDRRNGIEPFWSTHCKGQDSYVGNVRLRDIIAYNYFRKGYIYNVFRPF